MGRHAQGFQIRPPPKGRTCWSVRFRLDGKRVEVGTGERDRAAAAKKAREIYAAAVSGKRLSGAAPSLTVEVTAAWLDDLTVRPVTKGTYEKYASYWLRSIRRLEEFAIASYFRKRLREVRGKSVRSELSAFRSLLRWMVETGHLDEVPPLPKLKSSDLGTAYKERRRTAAPEITEREVRAVIRALPERPGRGTWWVRARCEFLYETALRPTTVDSIRVPDHWAPGSKTLRVTADVDKEGFAREVPLSARALAILKRCAPKGGVIFGPGHKYDRYIHAAAAKALPPAKAAVFTAQHLRSARGTHLLDRGAPLSGVQQLYGHKHTSTTARYIRPTFKAAQEALKKAR